MRNGMKELVNVKGSRGIQSTWLCKRLRWGFKSVSTSKLGL